MMPDVPISLGTRDLFGKLDLGTERCFIGFDLKHVHKLHSFAKLIAMVGMNNIETLVAMIREQKVYRCGFRVQLGELIVHPVGKYSIRLPVQFWQ